ncbi:MAG: type II toxin-antitoxin system PemK/MazF family toxin [Candidatus Peregrinibacteria bacterium]
MALSFPSHLILQGDIFWADLNPIQGSEQSGVRPVLVIQNNILNDRMNTVVIFPITTNLNAKDKMTTFFLSAPLTGLPQDSVALLFPVRTIDKSRLRQKVGNISPQDLLEIKERFSYVL